MIDLFITTRVETRQAEPLMQHLENCGVHPARISDESHIAGRVVKVECSPDEAQEYANHFASFKEEE